MQLTAGQFADIDATYRQERITASFRDHAAGRRLAFKRRGTRPTGTQASRHTLRAA